MADGLFGSLASSLSGLFGDSSTLSTIGGLADFGVGAYDLYRGFQSDSSSQDYLNALMASQDVSDSIIQGQYKRAQDIYYPIEDLQAQYALADLKALRPLQEAQQSYGLTRGYADIDLAKNTVDPTRTGLIQQLAAGAPAQRFMDIASADVQQSYDQALADTQRAYARSGINPNSGAYQSLLQQNMMSKAAAEAGARTEAARIAEDLDISRKGQALNLFAGIPLTSTQAPQSGTALATQAASGLQTSAQNLQKAAALTSGMAGDYYAGATSTFKNLGDYFGTGNSSKASS